MSAQSHTIHDEPGPFGSTQKLTFDGPVTGTAQIGMVVSWFSAPSAGDEFTPPRESVSVAIDAHWDGQSLTHEGRTYTEARFLTSVVATDDGYTFEDNGLLDGIDDAPRADRDAIRTALTDAARTFVTRARIAEERLRVAERAAHYARKNLATAQAREAWMTAALDVARTEFAYAGGQR